VKILKGKQAHHISDVHLQIDVRAQQMATLA
jgi:hypothetical protein